MATFPNTPILDDFNYADGALVSTIWGKDPIYVGDSLAVVSSNGAVGPSSAYGDARTHLAYKLPVEAYITWSGKGAGPEIGLYWLCQNPNTVNMNTYYLVANESGGVGQITVWKTIAGVDTQLGSTFTGLTHTAGDKIGVHMDSDGTIHIWRDTGAGWAELGTRGPDTTLSVGDLGFYAYNTDNKIDNFGGGSPFVLPRIG